MSVISRAALVSISRSGWSLSVFYNQITIRTDEECVQFVTLTQSRCRRKRTPMTRTGIWNRVSTTSDVSMSFAIGFYVFVDMEFHSSCKISSFWNVLWVHYPTSNGTLMSSLSIRGYFKIRCTGLMMTDPMLKQTISSRSVNTPSSNTLLTSG